VLRDDGEVTAPVEAFVAYLRPSFGRVSSRKVDRLSTVRFGSARYPVPAAATTEAAVGPLQLVSLVPAIIVVNIKLRRSRAPTEQAVIVEGGATGATAGSYESETSMFTHPVDRSRISRRGGGTPERPQVDRAHPRCSHLNHLSGDVAERGAPGDRSLYNDDAHGTRIDTLGGNLLDVEGRQAPLREQNSIPAHVDNGGRPHLEGTPVHPCSAGTVPTVADVHNEAGEGEG
jgi:hypothetical protein